MRQINHHLARMFKVNGRFTINVGLYLTQSPIRLARMADQHARLVYPLHPIPPKDPPMPDKPDLSALLGSRICHDLISPIGAIGNGVELLMMEGSSGGPEIALISESVANANARIRFFRVAFGLAQAEQRMGRAEVQSILSDLTQGGRLTIDWASGADHLRTEVKIAFLLIQCLENAMAYGGKISVVEQDGRWQITGQAPKLRILTELWEVLVNPNAATEITPAQVQFPLVADEIARQGLRLTAELGDTTIKLTF